MSPCSLSSFRRRETVVEVLSTIRLRSVKRMARPCWSNTSMMCMALERVKTSNKSSMRP